MHHERPGLLYLMGIWGRRLAASLSHQSLSIAPTAMPSISVTPIPYAVPITAAGIEDADADARHRYNSVSAIVTAIARGPAMKTSATPLSGLGRRNRREGRSSRDRGKQDFPHDALLACAPLAALSGHQISVERGWAAFPSLPFRFSRARSRLPQASLRASCLVERQLVYRRCPEAAGRQSAITRRNLEYE